MPCVERIERRPLTYGALSYQCVQYAQAMYQMTPDEVIQCSRAISFGGPDNAIPFREFLDAPNLGMIQTSLQKFHLGQSTDSRAFIQCSKPRRGWGITPCEVHQNVRVQETHRQDCPRRSACSRRRRANSLLSPISLRSFHIPIKPSFFSAATSSFPVFGKTVSTLDARGLTVDAARISRMRKTRASPFFLRATVSPLATTERSKRPFIAGSRSASNSH